MSPDQELRQLVAGALADMAAAWPRSKIDPAGLLDVYLRGLRGVPLASIRPAVDALLQRQSIRFAPPPGDLRAECLRIAEVRGLFTAAATPAAAPRGRFSGFPEAPCPVCGTVPEIVAEWTPDARRWKAGAFLSDQVQYRVTYPPACACWEHDRPQRHVYRHADWLTPGQIWAARQHLPEREVPDDVDVLHAELAVLMAPHIPHAPKVQPAIAWRADESHADIAPTVIGPQPGPSLDEIARTSA